MNGRWKEVVKLTFKGERFQDHALDLTALAELSQFQKMVAETAKALWRAANPGKYLPRHFEDRTRLCLRRIDEGSAVAPLEVYEPPVQIEMYDREPVEEAVGLAYDVFRALGHDAPLPDRFPRALVAEFAKWGEELVEDEAIEISRNGEEPARVDAAVRARWATFTETIHESETEITGEVLEADVRQRKFQVWTDEKSGVSVTFSPAEEEKVTNALHEHRQLRVRVVGRGEFSAQGKLQRIVDLKHLEIFPAQGETFDETARPIEDILAELASQVPAEEWAKLPADINDNLDHYLYGAPRR